MTAAAVIDPAAFQAWIASRTLGPVACTGQTDIGLRRAPSAARIDQGSGGEVIEGGTALDQGEVIEVEGGRGPRSGSSTLDPRPVEVEGLGSVAPWVPRGMERIPQAKLGHFNMTEPICDFMA